MADTLHERRAARNRDLERLYSTEQPPQTSIIGVLLILFIGFIMGLAIGWWL